MTYTITHSPDPLAPRRMVIEWDDGALLGVRLDAFDLALLHECDSSPKLSDKLLALELLARRLEEVTT